MAKPAAVINAREEMVICCPYHPQAELVEDYGSGDYICTACGLVVGDRVVYMSCEWRPLSSTNGYTATAGPPRVGTEQSLFDGRDLSANLRPTRTRRTPHGGLANDLKNPTLTPSEKTAASASVIALMIRDTADRINAPRVVVDRANRIFERVQNGKHLKGRVRGAIAAACLYTSCRQEKSPRSFKKICAVTDVSRKEIARCYKLLTLETYIELTKADDFASHFSSILGLSFAEQHSASYIAREAIERHVVTGKSTVAVIAAAIYVVSQVPNCNAEKPTLEQIADVTGAAQATIRYAYQEIRSLAVKLFPNGIHVINPLKSLIDILCMSKSHDANNLPLMT